MRRSRLGIVHTAEIVPRWHSPLGMCHFAKDARNDTFKNLSLGRWLRAKGSTAPIDRFTVYGVILLGRGILHVAAS